MGGAAVVEVDGLCADSARLAEICERYGIAELAVFGSVARGDAGPNSDVDLLYALAPGARLGFRIDDLEDELASRFGRDEVATTLYARDRNRPRCARLNGAR